MIIAATVSSYVFGVEAHGYRGKPVNLSTDSRGCSDVYNRCANRATPGFKHTVTVRFTDGVFPHANTCINTLYLPLSSVTFEEFTYVQYMLWNIEFSRLWPCVAILPVMLFL